MLKIILLFLAFALIILCLLQEDKTDGIMSLTSGASNIRLFQSQKERGAEKTIAIATAIVGGVYMLLVAISAFVNL
jgi:protein translocase SecG subunit